MRGRYDILPVMPTVDLVDETFIAVDRGILVPIIADEGRWRMWWPQWRMSVFMDRREQGIRWSISGSLVGSCEIWLESVLDGVLLHYYLRADPAVPGSPTTPRELPSSPSGRRAAAALRRRQALSWKSHAWRLKDELESGRRPGQAARSGSLPTA
jgi:hypothetical protein